MTEPVTAGADPWPDHIRLSDIEHRFVCEVCGKRGDTGGFVAAPAHA